MRIFRSAMKGKFWVSPMVVAVSVFAAPSAKGIEKEHNLAMNIKSIQLTPTRQGYEEFKIAVNGSNLLNPYRSSELAVDGLFTLPSGQVMRVPAFFDGPKGWKLRFYARETGACKVKVQVKVKGNLASEKEGPTFAIDHVNDPGMVRVSQRSPRYLELDNGEGFFIVGQNVCFTTEVAKAIPCNKMASESLPWDQAYPRWFGKMGKNGANWARIWMRPDFTLETGKPWEWSLENARKVDKLMAMARQNGLYICLCFNAERSDGGGAMGGSFPPFAASTTAWGPLMSEQGLTFGDFATNERAKEMYRDKIRYIVARWGALTHLGAWEFWNEIDTVEFGGAVKWSKEMTAYLREVDPWKHLIKSSGSLPGSQQLWGTEHGDFNDVHPYFGWAGDEEPKNLGSFLTKFSSDVRQNPQPYIIGETGIAREVTTKYGLAGDLADKDTTGYHVYEGLYGGLFSGSVGGGLLWWWDEHIDRPNVYSRFKAFRSFVKGIEFNKEPFVVDGDVVVDHEVLSVQCLSSNRTKLLWVRLKDKNWFTVAVEKKHFEPVSSVLVKMGHVEPGSYRVEFWDSELGKRVSMQAQTVGDTREMEIRLPLIDKDVAVKMIRK